MGIFDRFPYSSTHEMNLDYMLGKATEIAEDMQTVTTGMAQVQAGLSAISEKTEQATDAAAQAAASASSIEGSVTAAEEAAEEAQMHNESAQTWANNAMTYKADCQRSATEAAASSSSAAQAATAAAASEDTVAQYAQAANASAQSAANNNDSAHQYANQASASASNATFHSSNAQTAATNAQTAATNANTSATNASASADRAAFLKTDVETLHRMCVAAVDQAATEAVNAANSAAQAAATKTDVENLVESLPEDFTDLNNTVNQLSDDIDNIYSCVTNDSEYFNRGTLSVGQTEDAIGKNIFGVGSSSGDFVKEFTPYFTQSYTGQFEWAIVNVPFANKTVSKSISWNTANAGDTIPVNTKLSETKLLMVKTSVDPSLLYGASVGGIIMRSIKWKTDNSAYVANKQTTLYQDCFSGKYVIENRNNLSNIPEELSEIDSRVSVLENSGAPWNGKKWTVIGDSLTEANSRTTKHYFDYISEQTGITIENLGYSGTGYKKESSTKGPFYDRLNLIPNDTDVVTFFGSGNDMSLSLGSVSDNTTDTVCGCINKTFDDLNTLYPLMKFGVITPTPWKTYPLTGSNAMISYCEALVTICKNRGIPCLDLFHCSLLRPWNETFQTLAYSKDFNNGVCNGMHPDETGHKMIAPMIKEFVKQLLLY